jgi:hypothetical protein
MSSLCGAYSRHDGHHMEAVIMLQIPTITQFYASSHEMEDFAHSHGGSAQKFLPTSIEYCTVRVSHATCTWAPRLHSTIDSINSFNKMLNWQLERASDTNIDTPTWATMVLNGARARGRTHSLLLRVRTSKKLSDKGRPTLVCEPHELRLGNCRPADLWTTLPRTGYGYIP